MKRIEDRFRGPGAERPLYPSDRVFVVRVPSVFEPVGERLDGRVEHIGTHSGREFAGLEDLAAFIREVLGERGGDSARSPNNDTNRRR